MNGRFSGTKFNNWFCKAHVKTAAAMFIVAAAALIAFAAVSDNRLAVRFCIDNVSRPLRDGLGTLCAAVPFSVMELMYLAAAVWLVLHGVRTVIILIRCHGLRNLFKSMALRLLLLVSVVMTLLAGYCWLWGMDYNGESFAVRSNIAVHPVTAEELCETAKFFLENANTLSQTVPRDEYGKLDIDSQTVVAGYKGLYDELEQRFPVLEGASRRPKMMAASRFMSKIGFTGVYFPFTGESNINVDAPVSLMPLTVAHELAHQRGVYAENECNFLGVAACVGSDDPIYQYAGYFGGLIYLMNELYDLDIDAWTRLRSSFSPQLEADWQQNNAYWRSFEGKTEEIAGEIYDSYLKANGQEMGILSYDACVELIVVYFADEMM